MKTIFLCNSPEQIKRVYRTDEAVYTKDDILAKPDKFSGTEIIFSTWGMPVFTTEEIRTLLPSAKAVFYAAGTVQRFAAPFLECGVRVFSAWKANAVPVAEYALSQILLANKGFFSLCQGMRTSAEESSRQAKCYPGNYNVSIGILGVGAIGRLVCKHLLAFDVRVLAYDPFLPEDMAADLGIELTDLDTIFSTCQVVSNHLADNPDTKGILMGAYFASMVPYATFINTGRGAQVMEDQLIEVLEKRPDLSVVLDVTDPEPPAEGSRLYTLPNCFLTPHIAGSSGREVERMAEYMKDEYARYTKGEFCPYEVTAEMLRTMA